MYLLLLALLGSAAAGPLTEVARSPTNEELAEIYYLPREVYPTFYDVRLFLNPDQPANFTGDVSIRIIPNINTTLITLHAMDMTINSIQVYSDRNNTNLYSNHTLATDDTHLLRVSTTQVLEAGQGYTITLDYVGHYAENMFGIYLSTFTTIAGTPGRLITSQLQPTFARRAFPCFDEPALKAVFRTTVYAPPAYPVVRSNMPLRNDQLKPNVTGWVRHEFQDTLEMSTYLIAYLVSDFGSIDNSQNPIYRIPFRIYSRVGTEHTGAFALDFGQRNMIALEQYTEFNYAFPKMDKVAAPDFAAGAMENWGLVIYREVALLVREGVTTTSVRQNIGRIICHENMHMWFGNEVGPWSWTYTWLNEGFANFFENFATDLVLPEWRMMDQYVIALQNVFQNDAVATVNPMTHPVFSPSQILSTFNAVAYQKSGSVIRMLQHILTPEVFRRGLVIYIRNLSRRAAQPDDLYRSLQEALNNSTNNAVNWPIATIMGRWSTQGGFPVVTVTRDAPTANSVTVAQERFLTDRSQTSDHRWHIPLNWVLSTNPNFTDTSPQGWAGPGFPAASIDIPGLQQAEWFIVNKQQTGYYRVNYDVENWRALARVLNTSHQTIHLLNRAQIVDDSFNLARNGRLEYDYALEISRYLVQEQDYIPWAAANAAFNYLDVVLASSDVFELWQRYVLELTAPQYARLGFTPAAGEEHVTPYHRNIILNFNCGYGNANCVTTAESLLQDFRNNNNRPIPDIQTSVYCSGLRGGDVDNFNFLWSQYLASTDSSEQSIYLNALGCTSNNQTRLFYLNQVITDNSPVREQDRHTIVVATLNASPENMEVALDFIVENFHLIQPRVQGLTGTTNILNGFARRLTSPQHAEKIDELVRIHGNILTAGEQAAISAIRDNIAASTVWTQTYFPQVRDWLRAYYNVPSVPDSANAISASFIIFVSAIVALLNY